MKLQLRSAAKVNLTLDILRRRPDGYHELASVVHTIALWDEIKIEFSQDEAVSFTCNRTELAGQDNLCVRAVHIWNKATGDQIGARIHLEKRIPTGAGLGGGSGNAAAILLALNRYSRREVTNEKIREIGASLGADVPLFLDGGAVLMEGVGEKLTPLSPKSGWVVVIKPAESFSTPQIYRLWGEKTHVSDRATTQMLENWHQGSLEALAQDMDNDLQVAAQSASTLPAECSRLLLEAGALGAQMSGSGSACFGIFATEASAQNAREELVRKLAKLVLLTDAQVFVADFCNFGVQIAPD